MADDNAAMAEALRYGDDDDPNSVVVRPNPFGDIARAAGSTTSLALAALITATVTLLDMSVANDIADARLYSTRGVDNLTGLRWAAGVRLIIAGVALVLAVVAGVRYSRSLPATRYTFSPDGEEAVESTVGAEAPGWVTLLVGAGMAVSLLAIVVNAVALVYTLKLHQSPNFGLPGA